jgi:outer membrane lipoprotein-sorting protein
MSRRMIALASAVAAAAAVAVVVTLFGSGAQVTLAQVAEAVAKTRSMTCKQIDKAPGVKRAASRVTILDNLVRMDMPDGSYTVMDMNKGKVLAVLASNKTTWLTEGLSMPTGLNLYDMFRSMAEEKSQRLPDETLDGRTMNVFRVDVAERFRNPQTGGPQFSSPRPIKVWVDPKTKLPVRMESAVSDKNKTTEVIYDIEFDRPLDANVFDMTPPKGYKVLDVDDRRSATHKTIKMPFSEVVSAVAKTRSMTGKMTVEFPGKPEKTETIHFSALDDVFRADMPDGTYTIMNPTKGESLCVSPREKKATVMVGLRSQPNAYEMVRNIVQEQSERLPDEMLNGRKTNVFRVNMSEALRKQQMHGERMPPMKVWVDPETKLPVRMEPIPSDKTAFYDLEFDRPLDPALFSMTPPEGYKVTTEGIATKWAPAPDKAELLSPEVKPGVGLGPVKFGMSKDEIIALCGKPDDVQEKHGAINVGYLSRGYAFSVPPTHGGLYTIFCYSQEACAFKIRDFTGKTKEGIGMGSSLKDLEKAMGKPDAMETNGPKTTYVRYTKLGLELTLSDDKVVDFMMKGDLALLAPRVIPGVGIGRVKFGMSKDEIIKICGKPDLVGERGGMISVDYPSRGYGFVVVPRRGGLITIRCISQEDSVFKVRDFAGKTREGIGIGSSLKDLEKAFGKPDRVESNSDAPGATGTNVEYGKLGLQFTLFYDKVVDLSMQADLSLLVPRVTPGTGIGPIKFGMSKDEIVKILGKPEVEEKTTLQYSSRGFALSVSPQRGLLLIDCFSQKTCAFKVHDFAGRTEEGIGIGSSLKELEEAFGKPDTARTEPSTTSKCVSYGKRGLSLTLYDDKVVGFMLSAPRK